MVADASTHVIRGTTVSVQWSRGAKDAGNGDRPRRRNSGNSNSSSGNGNGNSPSRGSSRSSSKMGGMFPHKGGRMGGGGGGARGVGCSHGFSPMRTRGAGHMHAPGAGGAAVPFGFAGGAHGEHHNQPMVRESSERTSVSSGPLWTRGVERVALVRAPGRRLDRFFWGGPMDCSDRSSGPQVRTIVHPVEAAFLWSELLRSRQRRIQFSGDVVVGFDRSILRAHMLNTTPPVFVGCRPIVQPPLHASVSLLLVSVAGPSPTVLAPFFLSPSSYPVIHSTHSLTPPVRPR